MADETVIIDKIGSLFLGGPPLVQAATGEIITPEELGGATVHCKVSGCTDYFAESEEAAIEDCKDIMASLNMPSNLKDSHFYEEPMYDPYELRAIALPFPDKSDLQLHGIMARIFDGSRFREFKQSFGPTLVTGFAHLHGILVGVVANNGPLMPNACLKGAHFVELCCQRNIPIIFLQNVVDPVNLSLEDAAALLKEKGKMMSVIANSNVPKITVVIGNSYGMDNFAMCGRSMGPRFMFLWPAARIALMDPTNGGTRENEMDQNLVSLMEAQSSAYFSTARLWDDGIILPQDTRRVLALCLKASLKHQKIGFSPKNVLRM